MPAQRHRLDQHLPITCILATLAASMLITWMIAVPLEKLRQRRVAAAHLTGKQADPKNQTSIPRANDR